MKNKWSNLLCTFLLVFSSNFIHAKTGEFDVGMQFKTTKILNIEKAITDFYLFNSSDIRIQKPENNIFLHNNASNLLKFVKVPLVVGIHFRYSYYFTPKIGISFSPEFFYGNIAAAKVLRTVVNKKKLNNANLDDGGSALYKIRVVGLGGNVRFLYDVLGSSLDFCDYERNNWKGTVSLGTKFDWFCNKKLVSRDSFGSNKSIESAATTKNGNEVFSGDRIISFVPGVIFGGDLVAPFNLGVGVDFAWYFRNLFSANDKIKEHDNKVTKGLRGKGFNPQYSTLCSFFQAGVRIYYDFAPFINNHEAPSEIDIEKW